MMRRTPQSRGSVYVLVLAISVLVTIVGGSAILANRIVFRTGQTEADTTQAGLLGSSAVEIVLQRMTDDTDWRRTYTHDTWTPRETLNPGAFRFKLYDEDGDLANDPTEDVTLYVRTESGDAVRMYRVQVETDDSSGTNLVQNAGGESGVSSWGVVSGGTLITDTVAPKNGTQAVGITDRTLATQGLIQDVSAGLESGKTCTVGMWVRMADAPGNVTVKLSTLGLSSPLSNDGFTAAVGTGWTYVSGTVDANWLGGLDLATLSIHTQGLDTQDFSVDDVRLYESTGATVSAVPGTYQQVVSN